MNRRAGRASVSGIVMIVLGAIALYFAFMYLPVLMHKMSIGDVARQAAAKMQVDFADAKIRESIRTDIKSRTGVEIGMSELLITRKGTLTTVNVKWTEQVKHLWGTNHVIKMEVTESVVPGNVKLKNAE